MSIQVGDKVYYGNDTAVVAKVNPEGTYATLMVGPFATFVSVDISTLKLAIEGEQMSLPGLLVQVTA